MNFLEERIQKDGIVKEGNVLKVDSFLNHQMDIRLLAQMGEEFKRGIRDRDSLHCRQIFRCAGGICKKDPEHQSGRRNVCGRGGILYP